MPADGQTLTELAREGKRHWGYPEPWLEAWRDTLAVTPEYIESNDVLCCEETGQTIGFIAFTRADSQPWLDHFWLRMSLIGTGRGAQLFRLAVRHLRGLGVERLMIESDPNAEGFYLHMGCRRVGSSVSRLTGMERVLPVLSYDVATPPAAE
ncbi:GNAT family N-acetyltransferase [Anatilimnocola sp. NA78]|uniref:GNAT family N-acetyltransferase n=1 Tax=Anatilimnocola sp. NA78 TaxID=3415683 RepID=UPI003CE47162